MRIGGCGRVGATAALELQEPCAHRSGGLRARVAETALGREEQLLQVALLLRGKSGVVVAPGATGAWDILAARAHPAHRACRSARTQGPLFACSCTLLSVRRGSSNPRLCIDHSGVRWLKQRLPRVPAQRRVRVASSLSCSFSCGPVSERSRQRLAARGSATTDRWSAPSHHQGRGVDAQVQGNLDWRAVTRDRAKARAQAPAGSSGHLALTRHSNTRRSWWMGHAAGAGPSVRVAVTDGPVALGRLPRSSSSGASTSGDARPHRRTL